jgi:16S rRNA (uracil1498-N3)-methyltransferase
VSVIASSNKHQPAGKVSIAISLVKSPARFEWFLEKATELGVSEIVPIICERTERQHFRYERMKAILVSAMLQSQQVWLPVLKEPIKFETLVREESMPNERVKLIAHCEDSTKQQLSSLKIGKTSDSIILIGPEGDFTSKEIEHALEHNYLPVALGETRLRTETAGVAAAVLLCMKQI